MGHSKVTLGLVGFEKMWTSKLACFLVLLGFLLQRVAAEDAHGEDCKLAGTYVFDSNPNDPQTGIFLATIGYSPDDIMKMQSLAPGTKKEVSFKDNIVTLKLITKVKTVEAAFEPGKEVDETPLIGSPVKTTAAIEKSKLTMVRKTPAGMVITEVLTCTDEGCVATFTAKETTAQIKWKRIEGGKPSWTAKLV